MDDEDRRRALEVWQEAYAHQMRGELEEAVRLYKESLAICPTAEAHTFLGWTYSFQGRLDEAIQECHRAIAVDPNFGNPYNDIGVYLMQQGDLDGAIPWLEKAKSAPRYEPRQFPYMNLGRIYIRRGQWAEALREFEAGVRVAPGDSEIRKMLHELRARFN
jgi:Tfp pilus assembly protein PilF